MKRITSALVALVAILALSVVAAPPAQAGAGSIRVNNNTGRSVWITIYASCGWSCAYHIIGGGYGAFCLPAHSHRYMDAWKRSPINQVKVRAEVKIRADCAGPTIGDTYDVRTHGNDRDEELIANVNSHHADDGYYVKIVGN